MVIQRWQSLLLLICAALMACCAFMNFGYIETTENTFALDALGIRYFEGATKGPDGATVFMHTWYFFILSMLCIIMPLIDIFLYSNLRLQMRVCMMEIMFIIANLAVGFTIGYTAIENGAFSWGSAILAGILALCAAGLALAYMRRDRNRLRSADRLR